MPSPIVSSNGTLQLVSLYGRFRRCDLLGVGMSLEMGLGSFKRLMQFQFFPLCFILVVQDVIPKPLVTVDMPTFGHHEL